VIEALETGAPGLQGMGWLAGMVHSLAMGAASSRFNYEALDLDENATRLRLNSTVVGVRNVGDKKVEVDYVQDGGPLRVTGDHCILACYNGLIPHLCPELPDKQKRRAALWRQGATCLCQCPSGQRARVLETGRNTGDLPQRSLHDAELCSDNHQEGRMIRWWS